MRDLPLLILLILIVGGLYLRLDQPAEWDDLLAACQTPAAKKAALLAAQPPPPPPPVVVKAPEPIAPVIVPPPPPAPPTNVVEAPAAPKVWAAPDPLPAQANWTWTTTKGVTYANVIVKSVEPSFVTILDDSGGARIAIADLPPDLQKQLNYDADAAKISDAEVAAAGVILDNEKKQRDLKRKADEANAPPSAPVELSAADKERMQVEIQELRKDINAKLRQIAASSVEGGYSHAVSSQSTYRDAVSDEANQINAMEDKMGVPRTANPVFYPYYPYYYYPY